MAVDLLAAVILRLDPSGSVFTSTHLLLAKLALDTNSIQPALAVIDRDVSFYPNMAGPRDPRPLCEKDLEPATYLSSTGLTGTLTSASVLEYDLISGLIYISRRDWAKAQRALERVIAHPAKDKSVSKIMADAYKKWLLVGLLHLGHAPTLPSYISPATKSSYLVLTPQYNMVASQFNTANAAQLRTDVETNAKLWDDDGNMSLIAEVVSAYQKWQILNLRQVYKNVPVSTIQSTTLSAETGETLKGTEEVVDLVSSMIESGMLKGQVEVGATAEETYLTFSDVDTSIPETDFAREITRSQLSIDALGKQYRLTNERLSGSKEYVKHLVRRSEKEDDEPEVRPFEAQIEDEDLMTGIVTSS